LMMGDMVSAGHHGDPRFGNSVRGEALINVKVNALIEFITALKNNEVQIREKR
jgi:hypothetical protein